jgi:hypothetical protein
MVYDMIMTKINRNTLSIGPVAIGVIINLARFVSGFYDPMLISY